MASKIAIAALVIVLVAVNWSIAGKERHLAEGRIVYLETAPVDPRSLMQGDYMALRFVVANEVHKVLPKARDQRRWRRDVDAADGYAIVHLGERGIGSFRRIHAGEPLSEGEIRIRYRVRNGEVKFATNAFFFQEGHAGLYQPARYGQFRVDDAGELLLVAMFDQDLNRLGPGDRR
jgi:uncharacterized membrane-anchored protein